MTDPADISDGNPSGFSRQDFESTLNSKTVSIGSLVDMEYNPDEHYEGNDEPSGVFTPGSTDVQAFRADGDVEVLSGNTLTVNDAPSTSNEVVRLSDLQGEITSITVADIDAPDLSSYSGALLLVTQADADVNDATLYFFDSAVSSGADSPYVVAGDGGYYVAIAGKHVKKQVIFKEGLRIPANVKIEFGDSNQWIQWSGTQFEFGIGGAVKHRFR